MTENGDAQEEEEPEGEMGGEASAWSQRQWLPPVAFLCCTEDCYPDRAQEARGLVQGPGGAGHRDRPHVPGKGNWIF